MPDNGPTKKILVVEDEESVRMAIEAGLEVIGGCDVRLAPDAETGMRMLGEDCPDILLLDLVMPVMDGMEFLRLLRAGPRERRPGKVILMTAHSKPVPEENMAALGLDQVLEKPFRLHELAEAVGADDPFKD
jgi:CheY-like chemotaxis protein